MFRRRPLARGLVRTAATTAVVAGSAAAVSGRSRVHQAGQAQEAADAEAYEQQVAAPPANAAPPPPGPPSSGEVIDQLKELAELRDQGVLTDEEFDAQKARVLGT